MNTASGGFALSSGGASLLGPLRPVLGTALGAAVDTGSVEGAAEDVIANTREVTDATATDEHDGVLLEVVTSPGM